MEDEITFQIFHENKSQSNSCGIDDVKFLLDKSVVKTFGMIYNYKLGYKITKDGKIFKVQLRDNTDENFRLVKTSLLLMTENETKFRIKFT